MKKISILILLANISLAACDNNSGTTPDQKVHRVIKGTELELVAPERFIPICESSMPIWESVNMSLTDTIHLLACFILKGDWQTPDTMTIDNLHPLLTVAIHKNMISESVSKEEFSGILKVMNKPVDESRVLLHEDDAFCYTVAGSKSIKVGQQVKEFDVVGINCMVLVKDKYLLLFLEDKIKDEIYLNSIRQLAMDWVRLMQENN